MRRLIIALGVAIIILGATTTSFLLLEPTLGPNFAFWPGAAAQWLLEQFGVSTTNRIHPWATLLFWWAAAWVVLSAISRRNTLPNPGVHTDARDGGAPVTPTR